MRIRNPGRPYNDGRSAGARTLLISYRTSVADRRSSPAHRHRQGLALRGARLVPGRTESRDERLHQAGEDVIDVSGDADARGDRGCGAEELDVAGHGRG